MFLSAILRSLAKNNSSVISCILGVPALKRQRRQAFRYNFRMKNAKDFHFNPSRNKPDKII